MEAEVNTQRILTQLQQKLPLQNKYHPDSSENRAVYKSNNPGFKEAHSSKRGDGDMERCAEVERRREAQRGSGTGSPTFTCGG